MNIWVVMSGERAHATNERRHRAAIISQQLSERGHKVTWWTTNFDHQDKKHVMPGTRFREFGKGLRLAFLHTSVTYSKNVSLSRLLNHWLVAREFRRQATLGESPDVIFCAYPTIDLASATIDIGKLYQRPVIIDVRDLWPDIFLSVLPAPFAPVARLALLWHFRLSKSIFKHATKVTAISESYLAWALRRGDRSDRHKHRVFPLGLREPIMPSYQASLATTASMGIDAKTKYFWFVGTFGNTYDLETVIKVARMCLESDLKVQFVFSGEGDLAEKWRSQGKNLHNVVFTGWLKENEIGAVAKLAYAGLMAYAPGAPQGLPNKLFEYLAAGLPVISSLKTECKDLIRNHNIGFTYEPGSARSLYESVVAITSDVAMRSQMAKRARDLFEEKYRVEKVYQELADFIEETALEGI